MRRGGCGPNSPQARICPNAGEHVRFPSSKAVAAYLAKKKMAKKNTAKKTAKQTARKKAA